MQDATSIVLTYIYINLLNGLGYLSDSDCYSSFSQENLLQTTVSKIIKNLLCYILKKYELQTCECFLVTVCRKPVCFDVHLAFIRLCQHHSHYKHCCVNDVPASQTPSDQSHATRRVHFSQEKRKYHNNDLESLKFFKKYHQTNSSLGFLFPYDCLTGKLKRYFPLMFFKPGNYLFPLTKHLVCSGAA